jgi:uncharacterized membrane protein
MLQIFITSVVGFIVFGALDYTWLAHIAKNFYLTRLNDHLPIKDGALAPYLPAVPIIYAIAILTIWIFILTRVTTLTSAALYGAALGFVMYAFYDFTNLATLKDYPWSVTIVDILWGTFVVAVVTTVMFLVKQALL